MARSRLAIALWVAGLALAAWQAAHTRFVADLSSFLPGSPSPVQRVLVDQLREGALSRALLVGIEGADPATRARVAREMAAALAADARFAAVAGADAGFAPERAFVLAHRYHLGPQVVPQRFEVAGLRAAIGETIELLASPAGLALAALVPRDPTLETLAILDHLRPGAGPQTRDGAWVSADGERALLLARTRAPGSDTDAQAEALAAVQAAFAAARPGEARLLASGPGVLSVHARALVRDDVRRLAAAGAVAIAVLLLAVYRSPVALGLGLLPVATGALAGVAAVSLGFGAVHGITLGFGTALIGEAIDYSIYLFVQAGDFGRAGDPAWIARFWPTMRLGLLTSVAGFCALLFSGLPGLVQLGVYAITGLVVAAAVTRFVLPSLLPAGFRIRDVTPAGQRLARLAARAPRGRALVALLAAAAVAVLAARWGTLWSFELSSLNPVGARERAIDRLLRADLGASDARHVVAARGESEAAALAAAERVGERLDALVARGTLGGYESPARFLPSAATQRARLASLPEPGVLRERLREALAGMPLSPARLEPFVADVARARASAPLTRADLAANRLGLALEGLLYRSSDGAWTALLGLAPGAEGGIDVAAVREAVRSSGADAVVVDVRAEVDRMYRDYFVRALAASLAGLAAIVLLLLAAQRSVRRVARVLMPVGAGVLVVAGAHAALGVQLTLLHLVGLLLVAAVGSNYALFFDRLALGEAMSAPRTLASLALANATSVAGFGVLAFSSVPVLQSIGATVAPGTLLTLLFAAALAAPAPASLIMGAAPPAAP